MYDNKRQVTSAAEIACHCQRTRTGGAHYLTCHARRLFLRPLHPPRKYSRTFGPFARLLPSNPVKIQIPHVEEIDNLDTDLIAYACSASLLRFEFLYARIFPPEAEAVCRIAVDKALLEALAISSRAALDWRSAIYTSPEQNQTSPASDTVVAPLLTTFGTA
ncbi:hypothetical protein BGX38DRAFT_918866 [Terfezia claveryi]|nr:hypothetical protein BGX38DRAFT_918866 [Terfezia claveryi]